MNSYPGRKAAWPGTPQSFLLGGVMFAGNIRNAYKVYSEWLFDKKWGVDTRGMVFHKKESADLLLINAEPYEATTPRQFHRIMKSFPKNFDLPETFFDMGCGKGRTLIMAEQHGFKRIIGVEFDPSLAKIADANIHGFHAKHPKASEIEVVCKDAGAYEFPDEDSVIYFYNPFTEIIMSNVLENIRRSARVSKGRYIIYQTEKCASLMSDSREFIKIFSGRNFTIYKMVL
jgi:predicted RNA methylase